MSVSFSTLIQRSRPLPHHAMNKALHDVLVKIPPTHITKLSNGVRVACEEGGARPSVFSLSAIPTISSTTGNDMHKLGKGLHRQFATIGVFIHGGTRLEGNNNAGVSRVLQRCGLIGTEKMNTGALKNALGELGGQLSIGVERDQMYMMLLLEKNKIEKGVGLLAEMVRRARLTNEDIEKAKKVVLSEQHEFEKRPNDVCMDNLFRCAYDSTEYGLGTPLYGTPDAIHRLSLDAIRQYRTTVLNGGNVVLVGTGAVDPTTLEKAAQTYFGDLPSSKPWSDLTSSSSYNNNNNNNNNNNKASLSLMEPARYIGGEYRLWNLRYKTTHLAWAFETCGASCADILPLSLACDILGPFHRSQHELGQHALYRVLKTFSSLDHATPTNTHFNEKSIETSEAFLHTFSETGLCGMQLVARQAQGGPGDGGVIVEVLQYTLAEWCRMAQKMLHAQELSQAKVNIKAKRLFQMDGGHLRAGQIAQEVKDYGRVLSTEEFFTRVEDVSENNVQEVLQHYFFSRKPVYSYLGYINHMPNYDWTQHWTYKYWY